MYSFMYFLINFPIKLVHKTREFFFKDPVFLILKYLLLGTYFYTSLNIFKTRKLCYTNVVFFGYSSTSLARNALQKFAILRKTFSSIVIENSSIKYVLLQIKYIIPRTIRRSQTKRDVSTRIT